MTDNSAIADWINEARAVTVAAEMARRGLKVAHEVNQPCPAPGCGGTDRFAVNLRKDIWLCRASGVGGDAIALCQHLDGTSFLAACETLTGRPPPGRLSAETPAERQERELRQSAAAEQAARRRNQEVLTSERYREAERQRAYGIWRGARPIAGTPVVEYLNLRGLRPFEGLRLRFLPDAKLWDRPAPHGKIVHVGPAMLAPIVRDGRFAGVHQTWIDLDQPDGKVMVADPETGELIAAKKIRGSKRGGRIELGAAEAADRLYVGEGIETVLSVRQSLERLRPQVFRRATFLSAVDLGNLAGRAAQTIPHPELQSIAKNGRCYPVRVPGPDPAEDEGPPIALPDGIRELVLLRDADSDPFRTEMAMVRAARRFAAARPDVEIFEMEPRPGSDFNDMLREMAA